MNRLLRLAGLSVLILLLTGCGSQRGYTGPSRSDTSVIRPFGVTILSVNDVSVSPSASGVDVLPGKNVVSFTINRTNYGMRTDDSRTFIIDMKALPNREYVLMGSPEGGALCAWAVNPDTGVANYKENAGCIRDTSAIH